MTAQTTSPRISLNLAAPNRQRGMVLFVALIAMVAMALAAVALVRSVDTTTLISGNLAFRQSTTSSGDIGVGDAIAALTTIKNENGGINVFMELTHPFNQDSATTGYYTNIDPALALTNTASWTDETSSDAVTDDSGNSYRYIIQRMCRLPTDPVEHPEQKLPRTSNCLFSASSADNNSKGVKGVNDMCDTAGCPPAGQSPLYRVTVRVVGAKNTVSYIQSIVH